MANLQVESIPGNTSLYCTGGVVLLGEIIKQATGMRVDRFAELYRVKPLAIKNTRWNYFKNDEKLDTGGHLSLTPRDLCKIGQLILNQGKWENHQVISKNVWDQFGLKLIRDLHSISVFLMYLLGSKATTGIYPD